MLFPFSQDLAHISLAWRIPGTGEPGGLPSMGVAQSQTQLKQLSSSSSSIILLSPPESRNPKELCRKTKYTFVDVVAVECWQNKILQFSAIEKNLEITQSKLLSVQM